MSQKTNTDIYNAINDTRKEILATLKAEVDPIKCDVKEMMNWRNRVVGQFSVIMIFVGAGINYLFDSVFPKK